MNSQYNLKFRHELKYYVNYAQYLTIRQRLRNLLSSDGQGFPGGMGGNFGGGGFGGFGNGNAAADTEQGSTKVFVETLIMIGVLIAATVFVVTFKRKRL